MHSSYKYLVIQARDVNVQNPTTYLTEDRYIALVDITMRKRTCLETPGDLIRGALQREVVPNWSELQEIFSSNRVI